LGVITILNNT